MRDIFNWNRTTDNFFRYHSTRPDSDGNHTVVYIPRLGADNPPREKLDLIVSKMSAYDLCKKPFGEPVAERKVQCCHRDNDWDGNCVIHSAPGQVRSSAYLSMDMADRERTAVNNLIHPQGPRWLSDRTALERTLREHIEVDHSRHEKLEERVANLEWLMGLAYQALEKLIGWYYKAKRRRPNVPRKKV